MLNIEAFRTFHEQIPNSFNGHSLIIQYEYRSIAEIDTADDFLLG